MCFLPQPSLSSGVLLWLSDQPPLYWLKALDRNHWQSWFAEQKRVKGPTDGLIKVVSFSIIQHKHSSKFHVTSPRKLTAIIQSKRKRGFLQQFNNNNVFLSVALYPRISVLFTTINSFSKHNLRMQFHKIIVYDIPTYP